MKKIISIIFVLILTASLGMAQGYNTAIGIRGGLSNGLTIKHFINHDTALEGLVSSRWGGFSITGLYQKYQPALELENFYWYYGFGGHIGFWEGKNVGWADDENDYTVIGIDGIIGLEYNFEEIPFNISVDWKPAFNFSGYSGFWGDEAALSLRYVFE